MLTAAPWLWLERGLGFLNDVSGFTELFETQRAAGWSGAVGVALRALAALALVAGTAAASLRAVRALLPRVGIPLRWASVFGVGTWLATVAFHALRGAGAFNLAGALLASVALGVAAARLAPGRAPLGWAIGREARAARGLWRLVRRSRHVFALAVFGGLALLIGLRALVIPPLGWDTLTYHGTRAAQWVQSGQFTFDPGPGPFDLYRHFFAGSEVLSAWAMLPFRSDLLVNLGTFVQWLGVGLAAWALARALGLREPFASSGACAVMFIPTLQLEVGSGYVEAALNAALLHGVALALVCLRAPRGPAALIAALSLGVAAGVKPHGALPGLLLAAALGARIAFFRGMPLARRAGWLAAALVCGSVPALPWVVHAWAETGRPLSPLPVEVLGVSLGEASPALAWYQERPELRPFEWATEKEALLRVLAPVGTAGEALGSLALVPLLGLPLGLWALVRSRRRIELLIVAASLVPLAVHFSDRTSVPRLLWPESVSRYLITFLGLAIPLGLAWCRPVGVASRLYRRLVLACPLLQAAFLLRHGWGAWEFREITLCALGLCLVAPLVGWALRRGRRASVAAGLAALLLGCPFLQARRDVTRHRAFEESFALHGFVDYWAGAVPLLDRPGERHVIAVTGGPTQAADEWFSYAFLGSRFQNRIRYVTPARDGGIAHFGPHGDLAVRADLERWRARLAEQGITEVLTFWPRSIEQEWMERNPQRFRKLAGDENWGLFRIAMVPSLER